MSIKDDKTCQFLYTEMNNNKSRFERNATDQRKTKEEEHNDHEETITKHVTLSR